MRHAYAPVATCLAALLAGGCSTGNAIKRQIGDVMRGPDYLYKTGESYEEDKTRLDEWRNIIALRAGLADPKTRPVQTLSPDELKQYRIGGFTFVDGQCNAYLETLRRFNIEKRAAVSQVGITQTAVAGALGAASVAAQELALTAVGLGLAGSTIDTVSAGLLYELEPALVADLVQRAQSHYRQDMLGAGHDPANLAEAEASIWAYAELCTPNQIEIFVKQSTQSSVASSGGGGRITFAQGAEKAGGTSPASPPVDQKALSSKPPSNPPSP